MAQLQAVLLHLDPPPFELHATGVRTLDLLIAELLATFESHQQFRCFLSLSGFCLDNLKQRGRTAFLKSLAQLSQSGRIAILKRPHYLPSPQLLTSARLQENFSLQESFWSEWGAKLSDDLFPVPFPAELSLTGKVRASTTLLELGSLSHWSEISAKLKQLLLKENTTFILTEELSVGGGAVPRERTAQESETKNYLASRVQLLWENLERVPELLSSRLEKAKAENRRVERTGSEERLRAARMYAHQASSTLLDQPLLPQAQRACIDALLHSEVELEGFLHPDVEPTVGWIRMSPAGGNTLINTQLSDFFLSPEGTLLEFDYKPRKVALFGAFPGNSFELVPSLPPEKRTPSQGKIIRRTLDLLSIRYDEELVYEGRSLHVVREFTFKAGIGAHLSNATTGFSCEYWVEGQLPKGLLLTLSLDFSSPSPALTPLIGKPLLCVGGVSEMRLSAEEPQQLGGTELPGGLFGTRIIDSVDDLSIDFRSSKQLEAMSFEPVSIGGVPQALNIRFTLSASRIFGDEKSNTIFVSVL